MIKRIVLTTLPMIFGAVIGTGDNATFNRRGVGLMISHTREG